jgi:alkylation response protein AidB-like acyl-CoA dehydrogenase
MRLADSPAGAAFRAELRDWLSDVVATLPPAPDKADWSAVHAFDSAWQKLLHDGGYAGIHWPKEYGGRGATPEEHLIFLEETAEAGAPSEGVNFVGLLHAGPTLIAEGRPDQRARHLPAILRGEEMWCQGFSEPGAGSDLASLSTRAVRDGDHYVVRGQKIWTSYAPVARYCELLVRTDPDAPKHRGISWLIMPMDLPGIEVRPLRTINGTAEFAELFLDDVRIPVANRVGEENDGWRVAMVTFGFERGTSLVGNLVESRRVATAIGRLAGVEADAAFRKEFGGLVAELDGLWALTKRNVTRAGRGGIDPAAASTFKLHYAEVAHRLGDLGVRTLGQRAAVFDEDADAEAHRTLGAAVHAFALSIAAGTSQIQRNIVAERALGLPKEP